MDNRIKTGRSSTQGYLLSFLFISLAFIPPLLMFLHQATYGVNVIYMDEWWLNDLMQQRHEGKLSLEMLWMNLYEHRYFFPRLAFLGLAWLNGSWNIQVEIFFGTFCQSLILLVLGRLLWQTQQRRNYFSGLPLLVISALLFSTIMWETRLWGYQLAWPLTNLFCLTALWLLTPTSSASTTISWGKFVFASLCAMAATFSLGTAVVIWPTLVVYISLRTKNWRYVFWWVLFGLTTLVVNYTLTFDGSRMPKVDNFYFLKMPDYPLHQLAMLGNVIVFWQTELWIKAVVGGIGLFLFVACTFWLWRISKRSSNLTPGYSSSLETLEAESVNSWAAALPWVAVGLFGILNAGGILSRRIQWFIEASIVSRYVEEVIFFWIGLSVLLWLAAQHLFSKIYWTKFVHKKISGETSVKYLKTRLQIIGLVSLGILAVAFGGSYILSYAEGLKGFQTWYSRYQPVVTGMANYPNYSPKLNTLVFPDINFPVNALAAMSKRQDYLFHPTAQAVAQQEKDKWAAYLQATRQPRYILPPEFISISGNGSSIEKTTEHFRYKPGSKLTTDFIIKLEADSFLQNALSGTKLKKQVWDVRAENAQLIGVYWDTGKGFTDDEFTYIGRFSGLPANNPVGYHFLFTLPPQTKKCRIAVIFSPDTKPIEATIRIDVYDDGTFVAG